jgi:hypothetical protein
MTAADDPYEPQPPTQCAGLVEAAASALRKEAEGKGLCLQFEARDIDLALRVDCRALSRDVLQLIQRAIEDNTDGTIWIGVSRVMREGQRLVEIRVASTGFTDALLLPDR